MTRDEIIAQLQWRLTLGAELANAVAAMEKLKSTFSLFQTVMGGHLENYHIPTLTQITQDAAIFDGYLTQIMQAFNAKGPDGGQSAAHPVSDPAPAVMVGQIQGDTTIR